MEKVRERKKDRCQEIREQDWEEKQKEKKVEALEIRHGEDRREIKGDENEVEILESGERRGKKKVKRIREIS